MFIGKAIRAFGRRVIGEERAKIEQSLAVEKRTVFGPRVIGTKAIPGTNTPAPDSEPVSTPKQAAVANETISVAAMQKMLDANPAYIDHYLEMERGRAGGPRRKAVKAMLISERKNARRAEVLKQLQRMDPGDAADFPEDLSGAQLAEHHKEAGEEAGPLKPAEEVLTK